MRNDGSIRIGIETDDSKFNSQMKQLELKIQTAEDKSKELAESMQDTSGAIETLSQEIDKVNKGLLDEEAILKRIDDMAAQGFDFREDFNQMTETMSSQEAYLNIIDFMQTGLKETLAEQSNKYKEINGQAEIYKKKLEEMQGKQKKVSFSLKDLVKGARNLVLGIIGIRGAYNLVRKAASTYLQSDTALTKQLEANWIGLGAAIAPAVQLLIGVLRKAVTGVLYFLSVLTGENYIQKANKAITEQNTKAIQKNTKAKKENQKVTAGFDEMEIISDNQSDTSSVDNNELMPLFNLNELSKGTLETIEKIAKALQPIYEIIKKIVKWGLDNPEMLIAILGGVALLKFLSSVIGGAGTGLLGINSILAAIAAIGVISIFINVKTMYDSYQEAKDTIDNLRSKRIKEYKQAKKETNAVLENIDAYAKDKKARKELIESTKNQISTEKQSINAVIENTKNRSWLEKQIDNLTGAEENYSEQVYYSIATEYQNLKVLKALYERGLLNEEETRMYKEALDNFNDTLQGTSEEAEYVKSVFLENAETQKDYADMVDFTTDAMKKAGVQAGNTAEAIIKMARDINSQTIKPLVESTSLNNIDKVKNKLVEIKDIIKGLTTGNKVVPLALTVATQSQVNSLAEVFSKALGNVVVLGKKMAAGGIVNNPGRGVPIANNIIAGEAGPEAVLPLNDKTMNMLGKMIAQNMVVNLTTVNEMNGRVISRELNKINANNDFAYNR